MTDQTASIAQPTIQFPKAKQKRRQKCGYNISQRGERWLARVSNARTAQREAKTFGTKLEAEAWAKKRHAQFQLQLADAQTAPFDVLADEYMIDLRRRCRSDLHITTVGQTIDALKKGGLDDLAAPDAVSIVSRILLDLKTRHGGPASPKTRNNFLVRVHALANFAVKRDYLIKNRFVQIDFQKVVKRDKPVFSLSEVGRLVDPRHKDHPFYRPLGCMIYTGFRGSEMRHMQWDWFLWEANRVMLTMGANATATLDEEDEDDDESYITKTGRERMTCLPAELASVMRPGCPTDVRMFSQPVFPHLRDMERSKFQRLFNDYLTHCGVPLIKRRTPHSCRHTWTCIRLASGENEMLVKQQAGHSDKEMTEHYAKQQDRYRDQIEAAGWKRGDMRLYDFCPRAELST